MSRMHCAEPLGLETLLAYRLGETDDVQAERLEEHLFECPDCAKQLETLERLGAGVTWLARHGRVFGGTTLAALERAEAEGMRYGEYRMDPGQSVQCRIAPDHDCNVLRLAASFAGVERVDMAVVRHEAGVQTFAGRFEDVVVDRSSGEVVVVYPGEQLRPMGHHTVQIELLAPEGGGERSLASYTLFHSPWT